MLCVNRYSAEYVRGCRARFARHVAAYRALGAASASQPTKDRADLAAALKAFEPHFFNNPVLALDSCFTHRARALERKDGNPLNEVRMLCTSFTSGDGALLADKTIKYDHAKSVLKVRIGDRIELTDSDFVRLCEAFLAEIEARYASPDVGGLSSRPSGLEPQASLFPTMNATEKISIGATSEASTVVGQEATVRHFHPPMPAVYGTPFMICLMEVAAARAVEAALPTGDRRVRGQHSSPRRYTRRSHGDRPRQSRCGDGATDHL